MPTDTNVKQVIINKLTKAQYDAATKNPTELYLTPDEPASTTNLGPVKVDGTTITADADGTIHANSSGVPWGAITGTLSNQTDLQTALNAKQATISDLSTIRSGASAGATAVQPAALQTALNGKADVDLSNVSTTSGFRRLVEVYNNGTSWYKVFNEYDPSTGTLIGKWCEQGGIYTVSVTHGGTYDITLLKPYKDTAYSVLSSFFTDKNASTSAFTVQTCFSVKNTTGFNFNYGAQSGTSATLHYTWRASGYIA